MNEALLLIGMVIVICILMNRFLEKIPVPSLLIFIALGMLFGENGLFLKPADGQHGGHDDLVLDFNFSDFEGLEQLRITFFHGEILLVFLRQSVANLFRTCSEQIQHNTASAFCQ